MRKRFSRRHNSLVGAYPWLGPAALGLIVFVLVFALLRVFLPGVLVAVATPFWMTGSALSAGVGNAGALLSDKPALVAERDRLLADNAALYAKSANLEAEVADLTRLLGDRTEAGSGILAGVLVRPPVSPYDTLVIDQGERAGVAAGMRAEGPGGMPVGMVESASGGSARVILYSASGRETESWVGEARIPMTLIGRSAGAMSAIVAREAGIAVGDLVYVAGPGARPIGSVVSVENDPSLPRSRVEIKPLANPFSLTWVTIMP